MEAKTGLCMPESKEHKSFCGFCLLKTKSLIILNKRHFLAKIFQKNICLAKFHFGPNSSDHNVVSSSETGKFPDLALSPPMSRFVREFTLTSTAGLLLLVTAFRGKDGGQQIIGELPEKPHWSCLMACSVSCLFLPCNIVHDENGRHWCESRFAFSSLFITTDAEVAMIIKLIRTRWLNMVCITRVLVSKWLGDLFPLFGVATWEFLFSKGFPLSRALVVTTTGPAPAFL